MCTDCTGKKQKIKEICKFEIWPHKQLEHTKCKIQSHIHKHTPQTHANIHKRAQTHWNEDKQAMQGRAHTKIQKKDTPNALKRTYIAHKQQDLIKYNHTYAGTHKSLWHQVATSQVHYRLNLQLPCTWSIHLIKMSNAQTPCALGLPLALKWLKFYNWCTSSVR